MTWSSRRLVYAMQRLATTTRTTRQQPQQLLLRQRRRLLHNSSSSHMSIAAPPPHHPQQQQQQHHHHSADLARMMVPSDANVAGNVHGGTIMQMMEEAAGVVADRYLNSSPSFDGDNEIHNPKEGRRRLCALLSRVERMTFRHPVHVGDVAAVHAQVVFASQHSIAVSVQVTAERMAWSSSSTTTTSNRNNTRRHGRDDDQTVVSNHALMWLVGVVVPERWQDARRINPKDFERAPAPPLPIPDRHAQPDLWQHYHAAAQHYQNRHETRELFGDPSSTDPETDDDGTGDQNQSSSSSASKHVCFTPDYSAVELAQVMLPSDCTTDTGLVGGGVVMKLMDNACGVAAVRHCGTNVVTVSVDCVNFVAPVLVGDVLKVRARPTFTSNKTLELSVRVVAERFAYDPNDDDNGGGNLTRHEIVTTERAYFCFVSLPMAGRRDNDDTIPPASLPMRPLVLQTAADHAHFEQGQRRYKRRRGLIEQEQQREQQREQQHGNHSGTPHSKL